MSLFRNLLLNKPEKISRLRRYRIQVGYSDAIYNIKQPGSIISIQVGYPAGFSTLYGLGKPDHTSFIGGAALTEAYTYTGRQRVWDALYFYLEWNKTFDSMPEYRISVANAEGTLLFSSEENLNGKTFLSFSANSNDLKAYDGQTVTLQLEAILPVTK